LESQEGRLRHRHLFQVRKVILVFQVYQDSRDLAELTANQALTDHQDNVETRADKDHLETRVRKELREHRVQEGFLEVRVCQGDREHLETKE
jgi:hypothetical protein